VSEKIEVLFFPALTIGGEMELDKWYDSMIMCPSQCYCHKEVNGVHYILYLRWRYSDFWHAYVIQGARDEYSMRDGIWTDDLFLLHSKEFVHDEVDEAKKMLIWLFEEIYLK